MLIYCGGVKRSSAIRVAKCIEMLCWFTVIALSCSYQERVFKIYICLKFVSVVDTDMNDKQIWLTVMCNKI